MISDIADQGYKCNECEAAGAGASHNLMHAWLRVCIPMTRPLQPRRALLPILYQRQKVASDRGTIIGSESDSVNDNAVAGEPKFRVKDLLSLAEGCTSSFRYHSARERFMVSISSVYILRSLASLTQYYQ